MFVRDAVTTFATLQEKPMDYQKATEAFYATEEAFGDQFKQLYAPLCRYAYGFTKDPDEAEDVVQKVFLHTWENRHTLNAGISAKSYLYRAVYHACVSRGRHLKVKQAYMEQNLRDLQTGYGDPSGQSESAELERKIHQAIDALPEQCARTFRLSRFHQLSYKEIAETMQVSVKTVENQMGKALATLRLKLADYFMLLMMWIFFTIN